MRCNWCCRRGLSSTARVVDAYDGGTDDPKNSGGGGPACRSASLVVGTLTADTRDTPIDHPGSLSSDQLQSYHEFRRRMLQNPDTTYQDMIHGFCAVEDDEHAMCRYLRARKFDVDATIEMMRDRSELWRDGASNNFYPEFRDAIGTASVPESVFVSQLHLVLGNVTKTYCPVMYFSAGRVRADGLECLADFDIIPNYVWHLIVHKLPKHIQHLMDTNHLKTIPIELLVVANLDGISLNSLRRTLKALENAMRVLNVFPEVLSRVILINVPRYFMPFWPIVRSFVDNDTAQKFELFASSERGKNRLLQLVDLHLLASDCGGAGTSTNQLILEQCEQSAQGVRGRHEKILSCSRHGISTSAKISVYVRAQEFVSIRVFARASGRSAKLYVHVESSGSTKRIQLSRDVKDDTHPIFYTQVAGSSQGDMHCSIEIERGKGGGFVEHFLLVLDVRE